jgi:nanoRNase/pAp phosphatase (c-di-AMP/oligoRNAs hydrolase)
MDVSEIAKKFGGGGHPHASGFKIPYHLLPEFMR